MTEAPKKKITVYTLYLNDYLGEVAELTLPTIGSWAKRIGANFQLISTRKFEGWPITYEKLQLHQLMQENKDDWSIHVDADMLLHPDLPNLLENLMPGEIGVHVIYDPAPWFKFDDYFFRDGRRIGITSNFMAVPKECRDLLLPFDCSLEEASSGVSRLHGIDDYCFSRNLARFGLKMGGLLPEPEKQYMIRHLSAGGNSNNIKELYEEAQSILKKWPNF